MLNFFDEHIENNNLNKVQNKKSLSKFDNDFVNILFSTNENPDLYILVDKYLLQDQCQILYRLLNRVWLNDLKKQNSINIKIIYGFKTKINTDNLVTNIGWTYYDNMINFSNYIPQNNKILVLGKAIYFTTNGNTDINTDCFLDFILEETSFYSPFLKCQIFPIYDYFDFVGKDCFEHFFSLYNIKKCMLYDVKLKRELKINKIILRDKEEFKKILQENKDKKEICYDLETTSLDYITGNIICLTFTFDGITGYYIDWKNVDKEELDNFLKNKYQIGANLQFDIKFLKYKGISNTRVDFDIWTAGHIVYEDRSNSLKSQSFYFTQYGGYEFELELYKRKFKVKDYSLIPKNILSNYAIMDAIVTYKIYNKLKISFDLLDDKVTKNNDKIAEGWSLKKYFYDILIPATNIFIDISMEGINVDWNILDKQEKKVNELIQQTKNKLCNLLQVNEDILNIKTDDILFDDYYIEDINIDSAEQLGKVLEEKGFPEVDRSKKGIYTVNIDSLLKWKRCGGFFKEVAENIIYLHELNTLQKTFISGFKQYKNNVDNKIHSVFYVGLTESGRTRSANPNAQNFPARGWKAEIMKKIFVPEKDYVWYSVDESGLQLRLSAMINEDRIFRDVFLTKGGDMHSMTACSVILNNKISFEEFLKRKKEGDKEIKDARQKAKGVNFGLLFGAKEHTIKNTVVETEWGDDDVDKYIRDNKLNIIIDKYEKEDKKLTVSKAIRDNFFNTYKGLEKHLEQSKNSGKLNGYIQSIYGQIRRLPYLLYCNGKDENFKRVATFENICVNTYIQGMEAVVMLRITIQLFNWLKENKLKSKIVSAIHDALEMYLHKNEIEIVHNKCMELFSKYYPEFNGINIEGEANISDYHLGYYEIIKDKKTKEIISKEWKPALWDMGFDVEYYLDCIRNNKIPEKIIEK